MERKYAVLRVKDPSTGEMVELVTSTKSGENTPAKDGLSAYQIAQKNGFVGSEQEWLASLKGPQGEPGEDGQPGKPGDNGVSLGDVVLANELSTAAGSEKRAVTQKIVSEKLLELENSIGKAIDHGVGDTTFELTPNDLHVWGEVSSLNLTLAAPTENKEYKFQFTSGTQPTTLSLPESIKWIGSDAIEASKTYQVSILNNLAVRGGV